jgi:hypothetical protein
MPVTRVLQVMLVLAVLALGAGVAGVGGQVDGWDDTAENLPSATDSRTAQETRTSRSHPPRRRSCPVQPSTSW